MPSLHHRYSRGSIQNLCRERSFLPVLRVLLPVMAWIFIFSGVARVHAGSFPYPKGAPVAMQNGTYKIDGNTVQITIEVAREQSFDGPVSVACALTGCKIFAGPDAQSEATRQLTWGNADRKPKTAVFVVPRDEFFASTQPVVISLNSPKGAKLGRTSSLVAVPANAKWDDNKALAEATEGSLLLRVEETPNPPPASPLENRALAEVAPSAGESRSAL